MAEAVIPKPRKVRVKWSKVRSGCLKCKSRKVKCDEGKPGCARCLTYGCLCPGYLAERRTSTSGSNPGSARTITLRPLQKNTSSQENRNKSNPEEKLWKRRFSNHGYHQPVELAACAHRRRISADFPFQTPLWTNPSLSNSRNKLEYYYFPSFQEDLIPRFQGAFVISSLWSDLITEAIQVEPPLRYVAAAIAALQKALDIPVEHSDGHYHGDSGDERLQHYGFALRYYQEAVSYLKSITSAKIALVASLLFSSFETLNGRPDLAISTIKSGFKLLMNLRSRLGGSKTLLIASVGSNLIRIFGRLCIQVMPYAGIQEMPFYNVLCEGDLEDEIPTAFANIGEARHTLENIILRGLSGQMTKDTWGNTAVRSDAAVMDHTTGAAMAQSTQPATCGLVELCISDNMRWSRAFEPFVKSLSNTEISSEDFTNIIALQLHSKTTAILLARTIMTSESSFDAFLPDFQEIVHLCTLQLSQPSFAKHALFVSYGVNLPLFMTAAKCRHRATRHRAISLLRETQRSEGIWSGELAAAMGAWMAELEEGRSEDEDEARHSSLGGPFIPEERRVRLSRIALDYKLKKAKVVCTFCQKSPNGEPIHVETDLSWD